MHQNCTMKELDIPQFSNTCGKLYADKIVLATSNNESYIDIDKIHKVAFTARPELKSMLFIMLPLVLFALPMIMHEPDFFTKALFMTVGLVFLTIAVFQINNVYTLSLKLKDGTSMNINVWQGNRKEAQKFAGLVDAKLARR
jgi:hypothetical protein